MKILGLVKKEVGACEAYRVTYPMHALKEAGHATYSVCIDDFWDEISVGKRPWRGYDMILFQRLLIREDTPNDLNSAPISLREEGVSTVVDYDDDYTNNHRRVHSHILPDLRAFSSVTTSTPYLKRVMKDYADDIHVLPNAVPLDLFQGFKRNFDSRLTIIGLTGSSSHERDWKVVVEPLERVCARHPDVRVFVTGFMPDYLAEKPWVVTLGTMHPEFLKDNNGYNFFIPLSRYPYILRNTDILLCPVDPEDHFSWSKSNLKAIEGQASPRPLANGKEGGCAVIATGGKLPIYQDAIKHGKTGLLIQDHADSEQWYDAIMSLLADRGRMQSMQEAGIKHCRQFFDIRKRVLERVSVYEEIVRKDRVAALKPRRMK